MIYFCWLLRLFVWVVLLLLLWADHCDDQMRPRARHLDGTVLTHN